MADERMMHTRQHFSATGVQDNKGEGAQPGTPTVPSTPPQPPRWSKHRRREAWLLLVVLLLGAVTIVTLANVASQKGRATTVQSTTPPTSVTQGPSATPSVIIGTGEFREYPLPQSNSQMMRLAIDHQGRLWFGEMGRNYLAVFDPQTQTFEQMIPPQGRFGMMGMQVAPDDTIWFAEQYANYIGHYFPATGHFQIYPLPRLTIPDPSNPGKTLSLPSAPNDLALDAQGNVWFAELNADSLGRLDPRTGLMQHYPLAAKKSVQTLYPYGVTVDPEGMVWFTEMSNDRIGRLDPATGGIRFFTPPGPKVAPMEIASDAHGIIWATTFSSDLLLRLDPRTGTFSSYNASIPGSPQGGGIYGLVIAPSGDAWVTMLSENVIAHLDVTSHRFIYYRVPTENSEPLAIVMAPDQTLWFTEVDKIGMLRP